MKTTAIANFALCMILLEPGVAAQTLLESRSVAPILTEESMPEEAGECNLRATSAYRVSTFESAAFVPRTQLFCGFSARWSGELDVPIARVNGRYGLGDVAVSAKLKLRDQTSMIPAFVLGLETAFPTQRANVDDLEVRGIEVQPSVALFKQMGRVTIQGNVGLSIRSGGSERRYGRSYNGAATIPLRAGFALIGEVNASSSPSGTVLSFSPGVHHALGKDRYIAFALPISVSNGSAQLGAVLQFQMRVRRSRGVE